MGRRRKRLDADEPSLDGLELEDTGGELIHAIDRRLTQLLERDVRYAGWARAKNALRALLDSSGVGVREIGRVTKIGEGVSREVYAANVEHEDGTERAYAILLPRSDADAELSERTLRELRLVGKLQQRTFRFRIPAMLGAMREGGHTALVRHYASGIPLDLRAGRQPSIRPWEIVGEIAAAVHAVAGTEVEDVTVGSATRRAHALEQLTVLDELEPAEMQAALAWARENLPPDEPSTLVHGDLLGQNILLAFDGPHHVIDWEYAMRGDPAYDLAIVTRGAKQPFQIADGMTKLLDAYEAHGGRGVTREHVQLHELCLIAHWYREALAGRGSQPPAFELDRMRAVVRRLR